MAVALIDCDNFFASCERIMQPRLLKVPVAVLSNNDGCVIARTNEVKAAGVTMGQPYHECEKILKQIGAEVVSANFLLYRNCAKRLQSVLKHIPNNGIEIYSIDESFLFFDDTRIDNVTVWAANMRQLIYDWTGIPVTIGVAKSRSLAKVAVHVSKKTESHVADLRDTAAPTTEALLRKLPIHDVWGVGRRLAPKLSIVGIATAWDLAQLTPRSPALKLLNRTGQQVVAELCGWESLQEPPKSDQKTMAHTRSFGEAIAELTDVRSALGSFVDSLASSLRRQGLVAGHISVFLRYREQGTEQRSKMVYAERSIAPTADTFALEGIVQAMIVDIFETHKHYKKAGIIMSRLSPADRYQIALIDSGAAQINKSESLMRAIDVAREKTALPMQPAVTLLGTQKWRGKRQKLSPFDHASWQSLPRVY